MITYEIRILNMGEYVYQGEITLTGDKVELNFLDRREQKLFDIIGVGERG